MDPQDIAYVLQVLEGSLSPKELERHTFGEVFTPLERVDEMLSFLPAHVWSNPDLRWLDPANGIGNFPIKALLGQTEGPHSYPGLWRGLAKKIPDEAERARHIVESMLYMVDINPRNNRSAKALFRRLFAALPTPPTPNISHIDPKSGFLTERSLDWGLGRGPVGSFHVIMGNPPFQIGAVRAAMVTDKTRKAKKALGVTDDKAEANYWVRFVKRALEGGCLERGGYLVFIHPITWFKHDRLGAHEMILGRRLHALKIFKNNGPGTAFGAHGKISVAWYVLENLPASATTRTHVMYGAEPDYTEDLVLSPDSILILRYNAIYQKILASGVPLFGDAEDGVLRHGTLRSCAEGGRHRLITDIHEDGSMEFVGSKVAHVDQEEPKVIVGGLHKPVVFFDRRGDYGLFAKGQRNYFVGTPAELRAIEAFFRTRLSSLLVDYVKFEQDFLRPGYYPDVRHFMDRGPITDESLATMFGFTKAEKAIIAAHPAPVHLTEADLHRRSCKSLVGVGHGRQTRKN